MRITIKRIYEPRAAGDGFRVLVDRLWPRGVSKEAAHADLWLKDIAPSDGLRKWFNHDPDKWPEFERRYREELKEAVEAVAKFHDAVQGRSHVTLLYGAKDEEHNQAVVLRDYLEHHGGTIM